MTLHKPVLCALAAGSLMLAGNVFAQMTPPPPPPPPAAPMSPPPPPTPPNAPAMPMNNGNSMDDSGSMNDGSSHSASFQTAEGQVTVNSRPAAAPQVGPAPSFSQLANNAKSITEDQAGAYPPLANDFLHADRNRDGRVSKAEYDHWKQQL